MAKKSRENVQSLFSRLKSNESEPRGEPRRRQDRVETIGDGIIKDITMLRSLLARRQSRHEWTCIVVSKIRNRGYVYIYINNERTCSRLRERLLSVCPFHCLFQFSLRTRLCRGDEGTYRSIRRDLYDLSRGVQKREENFFHSRLPPHAFLVVGTFSIKIAIVSNERIHQYLYARRVLLVIVLLFLVIAIPNDFVQSILKRSKVIFTNFTIW